MQDRYAGDVGDFQKFGLLRVLCAAGAVSRLGVIWYLCDDENHNDDGRHVGYLQPSKRTGNRLQPCDPDLFAVMANVVQAGQRTVAELERSMVLPPQTSYYSPRLRRSLTAPDRAAWFNGALEATRDCDVVFLDPDNGLSLGVQRFPEKFAEPGELAQIAARGQSIVLYQHCDRSGTVVDQAVRRLRQAAEAASLDPLAAVVARRGTVRMFLVLAQPENRRVFESALRGLAEQPWGEHLEPVFADS